LNKFNFSTDKRYEMEDEEDFDDFKPMEEQKLNYNDIVIKTDNNTGSSNPLKQENCDSSNDEDIVDKYNKIVFFNEENLPRIRKSENLSDMTDFSGITPLLTYDKVKKNKINNHYKKTGRAYFHRTDSFSQPRSNSKVKLYKNK
jgi:hypothetical protein